MTQILARPRVLVLASRAPLDLTDGVDLIALHVFPRLKDRYHLTLIAPVAQTVGDQSQQQLVRAFDEVHLVAAPTRVTELLGWFAADASRLPLGQIGRLDLEVARAVRLELSELISGKRLDLIHVRNLSMAPFVRSYRAQPRLLEIIDSPSLGARRANRGAVGGRARRLLARIVEREARDFDASTTVSAQDAAVVRQHAPQARIEVVPNGVDTQNFSPGEKQSHEDTITFLGVMSYGPNIDAVRWLATSVVPLLRRTWPGLRVQIVGRDPDPEIFSIARESRLVLSGALPDIRPALAESTVFVAPMVSGTGIKNKVLEAMAMALPIVATTLAVEALEIQDGVHCLVADDAGDFAAAIDRLLKDPELRLRIGNNARRLVETQYSWDATARRYEDIYERLLREGPSGRLR